MHIPDGYLSPESCIALYGASMPFWHQASRRAMRVLSGRAAPMLAILAALSFTIQMFNLPVPTGTTAHAVGGTLIAIVLGPSAAIVGVSVALIIQALFFGDGGLTAVGANALNLAVALPLSGYAVYALLTRGRSVSDRRRVIAGALGGYVGINVAGLLVALELGLQPLLWTVNGRALYNPYGFEATIPAMAIAHITVAGFAEAALTALVVAYLLRAQRQLLVEDEPSAQTGHSFGRVQWGLLAALAAVVLLVPLGLLAQGGADFEWGAEELRGLVGYVPSGLADLERWSALAPFRDYQPPGIAGEASLLDQATGYILSAAFGTGLILVGTVGARLALNRRGRKESRGPGRLR